MMIAWQEVRLLQRLERGKLAWRLYIVHFVQYTVAPTKYFPFLKVFLKYIKQSSNIKFNFVCGNWQVYSS